MNTASMPHTPVNISCMRGHSLAASSKSVDMIPINIVIISSPIYSPATHHRRADKATRIASMP